MIYIRLFLSSIFFVFPSILHAASFDCEKAVSKIEKIICLDREVSDLDSNLGRLFYLLKGGSKSIVEDQKNWLKNTRCRLHTITTSPHQLIIPDHAEYLRFPPYVLS